MYSNKSSFQPCDRVGCASRVLMWNLSLSRSVSLEGMWLSSSGLAIGPRECCSLYRRRPSIRCSVDACLKLVRSRNLVRRREAGVSPDLFASAPNGGGSVFPSPVDSRRSCSGRKSRRLQVMLVMERGHSSECNVRRTIEGKFPKR